MYSTFPKVKHLLVIFSSDHIYYLAIMPAIDKPPFAHRHSDLHPDLSSGLIGLLMLSLSLVLWAISLTLPEVEGDTLAISA